MFGYMPVCGKRGTRSYRVLIATIIVLVGILSSRARAQLVITQTPPVSASIKYGNTQQMQLTLAHPNLTPEIATIVTTIDWTASDGSPGHAETSLNLTILRPYMLTKVRLTRYVPGTITVDDIAAIPDQTGILTINREISEGQKCDIEWQVK